MNNIFLIMENRIKVPQTINYLSEWAGFELPKGILNKGVTACGATTLAIEDEQKTIICCPRINLVKNKCQQHKNVLAVYGEVANATIEDYLRSNDNQKIMVTYDSFGRLSKLIGDKFDWRVVVDEYQSLLIDSSFKSETEIKLLDELKIFPYVTYLSATPIGDRYMREIKELKDIPYTVLEWSNIEKTEVKRVVSKRPIDNALEIVRNYKNGIYPKMGDVESKECVIFLNSVTNILNIIKKTELSPDEVNIIVASTEENDALVKKLGKDYEIGKIPLKGEAHKKFTFCTSTAFAGCDFYSTCASTFVISDNKRAYTAIDIATELVQIAGRQRLASNPFRHIITLIYNVDIGENEECAYKEMLQAKLEISRKIAESKNNETDKDIRANSIKETVTSQKINKYSDNYVWYNSEQDCFVVNDMAYLSDCFAYDVQKENYENSVIVKKQLEDNGFEVTGKEVISNYEEQLECLIRKEGFAERMKRYCEYRQQRETCKYMFPNDVLERQCEDLKVYYDLLGAERIKALGYKECNLKNEVASINNNAKLRVEFKKLLANRSLSADRIKSEMNSVYSKYGIKKKGKATDLTNIYGLNVEKHRVTVADGKREYVYEVR